MCNHRWIRFRVQILSNSFICSTLVLYILILESFIRIKSQSSCFNYLDATSLLQLLCGGAPIKRHPGVVQRGLDVPLVVPVDAQIGEDVWLVRDIASNASSRSDKVLYLHDIIDVLIIWSINTNDMSSCVIIFCCIIERTNL